MKKILKLTPEQKHNILKSIQKEIKAKIKKAPHYQLRHVFGADVAMKLSRIDNVHFDRAWHSAYEKHEHRLTLAPSFLNIVENDLNDVIQDFIDNNLGSCSLKHYFGERGLKIIGDMESDVVGSEDYKKAVAENIALVELRSNDKIRQLKRSLEDLGFDVSISKKKETA